MRKKLSFIFCLFMLFAFTTRIYAECNSEDLNEWATKIEVKFTEMEGKATYEENGVTKESSFAYILSLSDPRDDIKIVVTDQNGDKATARKYKIGQGAEIYGVGCFTNLEEETYIINVYGADGKACANELLRTLKYTVPRFNEYMKDRRCEGSDSELCKSFTNATKDMTEKEFNEKMGGNEKSPSSKFLEIIKEYGLYVLIPLVIVSVFYITKIRKYKQEERNR